MAAADRSLLQTESLLASGTIGQWVAFRYVYALQHVPDGAWALL
jgi:hypothetical protein